MAIYLCTLKVSFVFFCYLLGTILPISKFLTLIVINLIDFYMTTLTTMHCTMAGLTTKTLIYERNLQMVIMQT